MPAGRHHHQTSIRCYKCRLVHFTHTHTHTQPCAFPRTLSPKWSRKTLRDLSNDCVLDLVFSHMDSFLPELFNLRIPTTRSLLIGANLNSVRLGVAGAGGCITKDSVASTCCDFKMLKGWVCFSWKRPSDNTFFLKLLKFENVEGQHFASLTWCYFDTCFFCSGKPHSIDKGTFGSSTFKSSWSKHDSGC